MAPSQTWKSETLEETPCVLNAPCDSDACSNLKTNVQEKLMKRNGEILKVGKNMRISFIH